MVCGLQLKYTGYLLRCSQFNIKTNIFALQLSNCHANYKISADCALQKTFQGGWIITTYPLASNEILEIKNLEVTTENLEDK